jgi:hypothetical protein
LLKVALNTITPTLKNGWCHITILSPQSDY